MNLTHLRSLRPWRPVLAAFAALQLLAVAAPASAQVGLQRQTWLNGQAPGLLWYPTATAAQPQRFGPYPVNVAPGAAPGDGRFPLVLISHGTGGHELGHAWLAEALVRQGYVVAALRHPGDHFDDRSGVASPAYFADRPAVVSRVLDALLADPQWKDRIDAGRIAAFGHSAGGHTVLALAGARVDRARWLAHCAADGPGLREDPVLCALGGFSAARPAPRVPREDPLPDRRDARIRAVVAAAPMTLALDPASLAGVGVPVLVETPLADRVLAPQHHGLTLCRALPAAQCTGTPGAGHFAFFHPGTGPLGGPEGMDPADDPPGFDRRAWQAGAAARVTRFLADALR